MGAVLRKMLTDLGEAHPSVGEVRNIGLFGIVELVKRSKDKRADGSVEWFMRLRWLR